MEEEAYEEAEEEEEEDEVQVQVRLRRPPVLVSGRLWSEGRWWREAELGLHNWNSFILLSLVL